MSEDEKQAKVVQKKFSDFASVTGEGIEGVGLKNGQNVRFELTTDSVKVNPNPFRNARGQFAPTPQELENINNQRDVNEFLYEKIQQVEGGEIDLDGYATEEQLNEVDTASIERDEKLQDQIDELGDVDLSPVEDRLDDIEAVLPKVPAVIDPVEIGVQALKITGNRPSGAGGEAGSVLMWKAEAGGPASPYNECKLVVPDISVIDLSAPSIWWKQGDKVQQWDMGSAGWFTSGNVLHYSAAETFGDTLVDGLPIELFYIDPALTGDDFVDAIARTESKADDRKLQVEIEEIALALETLLVQKEHGQWKYIGFTGDNIPRNAGEFGLAVADIGSSQDNIITINQEDLKGITHGFGDTEVGDYIEIVNTEDPTSYALFVVTKAPEGTGIVNVEVALKDAGYNIWIGETCEIRFFAVNEQDLQLEDLDSRYLRKTGGHMSGGINMNTNHILGVQYLGMTGAREIQEGQTTRIKLDGRVDVKKAGTNKQGFVLRGATDQGNDGDLLSVYHNADGLDAINYRGKQDADTNLATVGYVDSKVGSGGGSSASGKIQAGVQLFQASRLSEGCFNLLDESGSTTSNCKVARGLTFHIYHSWDEWPWMKWDLRSGGQIHLTDMNGKYLMSKPVLSVEQYDASSGDNPEGALWHFDFSIYGFESETSLSGLYMLEFENCLEAG